MQCSYVKFFAVPVWHWCAISVVLTPVETGMSCHTAPRAAGAARPWPAVGNSFPACITQHTQRLDSFGASEEQFMPLSPTWWHSSDCKERNCRGIGKTQTKIPSLPFSPTLVGSKAMYIVNPLRRGTTERLYRIQFCNHFFILPVSFKTLLL